MAPALRNTEASTRDADKMPPIGVPPGGKSPALGQPTRFWFKVSGIPATQGSTRGFAIKNKTTGKYRAVITHDNKKTMPWRALIAAAASNATPTMIDGPVDITLTFILPRPASVSVAKRPMPCCKPDLDKLERAVLDALTGIAYQDDAQVVALIATKRYTTGPDGTHEPGLWVDVAPSRPIPPQY